MRLPDGDQIGYGPAIVRQSLQCDDSYCGELDDSTTNAPTEFISPGSPISVDALDGCLATAHDKTGDSKKGEYDDTYDANGGKITGVTSIEFGKALLKADDDSGKAGADSGDDVHGASIDNKPKIVNAPAIDYEIGDAPEPGEEILDAPVPDEVSNYARSREVKNRSTRCGAMPTARYNSSR